MEAAAHRTRGRTEAQAAEAATVGAAPVRYADVGRGDGGYSGQPGDTPSRKGNCCSRWFWGGRRPNSIMYYDTNYGSRTTLCATLRLKTPVSEVRKLNILGGEEVRG
ncbi:MAG: hypothetical protein JJU02_02910 [Cryomorphaceae bacterium]|nr:hypothetical protein [Cryomorphaceae bacterium]